MFTPQQIEQIAFGKAKFGGYDMEQVDEFLEPLTEDYVTLYKENALLKSKMRVLVGKLEEYRKNEAAAKEAIANAQKTCDRMVLEAQAKCDQMIKNANTVASASAAVAAPAPVVAAPVAVPADVARNTEALIAAENARVEEARKAANVKINEIQTQMRSCIQALERIKAANPAAVPAQEPAAVTADSVADVIAQNVEALVGTTEDTAPKAAPKHPTSDSTTSRFANLNLQFGRNYDPTSR